jgi:site-specific DNA-adenine methylase
MFLDPPYLQSVMTYSGTMDNDYYTKFQDYVNNSTNEILYTDNDHNDCILDKIIIKCQI